jgi:hypothetical protein
MSPPNVGRRVLALRYIRDTILAPTVIGLIVHYLATRLDLPHKPFLVLCGIVVGWPVKFSLAVRCQGLHRTWKARALGAVPAFEIRGKLFGNIDTVQEVNEASKNGFIGGFSL